MASIKELREEMRGLAQLAQSVVEDGDLSADEKRSKLDKVETDIKKTESELRDREYLDEKSKQFAGLIDANPETRSNSGGGWSGNVPPVDEPANNGESDVERAQFKGSIGRSILDTAGFKEKVRPNVGKGVRWSSGAIDIKMFRGSSNTKTTLFEDAQPQGGAALVGEDRQPGILPILFQRLTVEDLIPAGTTTSNTVRILKETTATNAASPTFEGAVKTASTLAFSQVDEPVRKIATTIKASDEMLEDFGQIQSYLDNRLMLFVNIETESELLGGSGTAPDLTGLLNRSGIGTQALGGDTIADAIYKAITKCRVDSFLDPTGVVIHPNDWQQVRLMKDGASGTSGNYYGGGPFYAPYGNGGYQSQDNIWGLPVSVTQNIAENTALVGAFATAAQIFNRHSLTVEVTNSNEDDFLRNLVAIRAERRLALAVYRPAAFVKVTGI